MRATQILQRRSSFFWIIWVVFLLCLAHIGGVTYHIYKSTIACEITAEQFCDDMRDYDLYFPDKLSDFFGMTVASRGSVCIASFSVNKFDFERFIKNMQFSEINDKKGRDEIVSRLTGIAADYPTLIILPLTGFTNVAKISSHDQDGPFICILWGDDTNISKCFFCLVGAE